MFSMHLRLCREVKHEDAEEGDDHDWEDDVGEVEERLGERTIHIRYPQQIGSEGSLKSRVRRVADYGRLRMGSNII